MMFTSLFKQMNYQALSLRQAPRNRGGLGLYTLFFIRTSKFWPGLVVLKFLHNVGLTCSFNNLKIVLVCIMSIITANKLVIQIGFCRQPAASYVH